MELGAIEMPQVVAQLHEMGRYIVEKRDARANSDAT